MRFQHSHFTYMYACLIEYIPLHTGIYDISTFPHVDIMQVHAHSAQLFFFVFYPATTLEKTTKEEDNSLYPGTHQTNRFCESHYSLWLHCYYMSPCL